MGPTPLDLFKLHPCNSPNDLRGTAREPYRHRSRFMRQEGPSIQLETGEVVELSWQERALCAQTDPEAFFPEKGGSTREAKRVCTSCDVRSECLEYALAHDERFGIWGGLSERERRRLKRRSA